MKRLLLPAMLALEVLCASHSFAYEVWMGTHLVPGAMATDLASWALTAAQLEGVNINLSSNVNDPASTAERRTIFAQFAHASPIYTELARTNVTIDPALTDELAFPKVEAALDRLFSASATYGYPVEMIMFYDNAATYQGTNYTYNWTTVEVQHMRDWLDANGHADVLLSYDARNNSAANRAWCVNPLVDHVVIEASTTELLGNQHSQITLLQWIWTNSATIGKKVILQIPRTEDAISQYAGTRRILQMLGTLLGYGDDGVRSSRLVFLPVTYNDNYPYVPETVSGGASYANNLTSICLSLIEQRSLFDGCTRTPTVADADSLVRLFPPTVSPIQDQTVPFNTSPGPMAFTVADDLTPVSALTLSSASSNPSLVPVANIVLGGSGANRTVTVTPAAGQSGNATITISVSDGTLASTAKFRITVLPVGVVAGTLYSKAADAGITEVPVVDSRTAASAYCGDTGSIPWVNRCTVYVFQLPNWGPVPAPFNDAGFTFEYADLVGTPPIIDLYGLGRRPSATVLAGDYYGQTAVPDPSDATRLQASILTGSTPLGLISTAPAGNSALISYLNAQYAGGAGAGQYVFLRLNSAAAKTGVARALLTLSEGGVAGLPDTRPRITYIATSNAPLAISAIADQTVSESTPTGAIPFTVGDYTTAASLLIVTASTNNPSLVPAANIVLGGSGANRTVTVTPTFEQSGTAVITLTVSDGISTRTSAFTLNVPRPANVVLALPAGGPLNDASTWDRALPIVGDTQLWRTGANAIRMAATPETFNGGTFVLQPGGEFAPGITSAVLTLNNVVLNGGTITMNAGGALVMDLSGDVLTLNSGTLKAGGTANTRDVRFRNGSLAGSGTVQVTGTDATGSDVEFQSTVAMKGFAGIFDVKDNGILNLPFIAPNNASFGIILSGTGKYAHDASVSLTSLVIDGTPIAPGIYTYSSFTPAQQAFFVGTSNTFTITVNNPPTISAIPTQTLSANTASTPIAFTVGDVETSTTALTLTGASSNTTLVPAAGIVLGGSGANRTVTITPAANKLGTAIITLNVNDGTATTSTTFIVNVTGTAAETWRFANFGTTANTGSAADLADPNKDGENNLLEFATGQDPDATGRTNTPLVRNGNALEFTYPRSIAAMTGGVTFTVEWSDTLAVDSWSSVGVTEQILANNGTVQTVKAACPAGASGRRFVRLRVAGS